MQDTNAISRITADSFTGQGSSSSRIDDFLEFGLACGDFESHSHEERKLERFVPNALSWPAAIGLPLRAGPPIHFSAFLIRADHFPSHVFGGSTSEVAIMQRFEAYSLHGAGNRLHNAVEFSLDPMAAALIAWVILFAAIPTPAPVRVMLKDLVGMWVTVGGDCSRGQHFFGENGTYKKWCFDSISQGEWFLRGGNKIILRHDPKAADAEIITVVGFERYSDHTVLDVRYQDGSREKWMK